MSSLFSTISFFFFGGSTVNTASYSKTLSITGPISNASSSLSEYFHILLSSITYGIWSSSQIFLPMWPRKAGTVDLFHYVIRGAYVSSLVFTVMAVGAFLIPPIHLGKQQTHGIMSGGECVCFS